LCRRYSCHQKRQSPDTTIEILTPDFLRQRGCFEFGGGKTGDVFITILETVASNTLTVAPGARYFHSNPPLLQTAFKELDPKNFHQIPAIMVGLGEERNEMLQLMD